MEKAKFFIRPILKRQILCALCKEAKGDLSFHIDGAYPTAWILCFKCAKSNSIEIGDLLDGDESNEG